MTLVVLSTPARAQDYTAWTVTTEKSELDGQTEVYAQAYSTNDVINSIGIAKKAAFFVFCKNSSTTIGFDFQNYMGNDDVRVRYSIDGGKVLSKIAGVSERGNVIGWWRGTGVGFLKTLLGKKKIVVAAPAYGQNPSEAVFDLQGFDVAMAQVRKACGW